MDAETRAAFARIDHWFELSQAQHLELRQQMDSQHQDLRQEIGDLRQQVGSLGQQVGSLGQEVGSLGQQVGSLGQEVGSLRQEVGSLRQQISRVEASLDALWAEFRTFRDWVTAQFAELRRGSNSPFGSNG